MIGVQDDGRGRAVRNRDDGQPRFACKLDRLDDLGAVRFRGHRDQHVARPGPRQVVRRHAARTGNGPHIRRRLVCQIGEVPGIRVVHTDAQHEGRARSEDRIARDLKAFCIGPGETRLDVADRRRHHVGVELAQLPALAQGLQPPGAVGETRGPAPDFLAKRLAEILVPLEAHRARHAHERIGLHPGRIRDLADRTDTHFAGVFQHIGCGLPRLGRQPAKRLAKQVQHGIGRQV